MAQGGESTCAPMVLQKSPQSIHLLRGTMHTIATETHFAKTPLNYPVFTTGWSPVAYARWHDFGRHSVRTPTNGAKHQPHKRADERRRAKTKP